MAPSGASVVPPRSLRTERRILALLGRCELRKVVAARSGATHRNDLSGSSEVVQKMTRKQKTLAEEFRGFDGREAALTPDLVQESLSLSAPRLQS